MSKRNKKVETALDKMNNFSARGDKCPICGKNFRYGCDHSVSEARNKLFENYIKSICEGKQ